MYFLELILPSITKLWSYSHPKMKPTLLKLSSVLNSPKLPPTDSHESISNAIQDTPRAHVPHSHIHPHVLTYMAYHPFLPLCLPNSSFRPLLPDLIKTSIVYPKPFSILIVPGPPELRSTDRSVLPADLLSHLREFEASIRSMHPTPPHID